MVNYRIRALFHILKQIENYAVAIDINDDRYMSNTGIARSLYMLNATNEIIQNTILSIFNMEDNLDHEKPAYHYRYHP